MIAVAAAVFLSAAAALYHGYHCTSGDGGAPYVARDSVQKDVCEAGGNGWGVLALMIAALAGAAFLAQRVLERWWRRAGSGLLAIAATAAVIAAPALVFWLANLPSDSCSDAERAEVDRWRAEGMHGDPPHDCETY